MSTNFKWGTLVVACLNRLRDSQDLHVPFIDAEVIPDFNGAPDVFVWFICQTSALKERFRSVALEACSRRLCNLAAEGGFPNASAESIRTDVTSLEDIEAGGGRFAFFR